MQNKTKQIIAISILGLALLSVGVFGLTQLKKETPAINDNLSTSLINDTRESIQVENLTKETTEPVSLKKEAVNRNTEEVEVKKTEPQIIKETIIKITDNTPQQQLNYDKNSVLQEGDYLKCLKDEHILQWSAGDNEWDCVRPGEAVFGKAVAERRHGIRETSTGVVYCNEENNLLVWEDDSWRCKPYNNSGANTDEQTLSFDVPSSLLSISNGNTTDLSSLENTDVLRDLNCNTGEIAKWNSIASQWECAVDAGGVGSTTFRGLTDTPNNYGTNGYLVQTDGVGTLSFIDPSGYLDNTDNQALSIVGHTISLVNGGSVTVPDNDNQDLSYNGVTNILSLTNDGTTVDLSGLSDSGTDDQTVDVFNLAGTVLNLSLEDDGVVNYTVDLASLGATTFIELTDTPAAYTANYLTRVNAAGNALEFVDGDGIYHRQGGNSYGLLSTLGTNDNFGLALETNNITRATFDTAGNLNTTVNIIPTVDDTYDLGNSTNRFQDLYLGPASLHIGIDGDEGILSYNTANDTFDFDHAISLGTTAGGVAGNMRWSGIDFEGHDGTNWVSLTSGGGGGDTDWTINGGNLEIGVAGSALFNSDIAAANPAISFLGHTNYGMNYESLIIDGQFPSLTFITNGQQQMRINSAGNISVNMPGSLPDYMFNVGGGNTGTAGFSGAVTFGAYSANRYTFPVTDGANGQVLKTDGNGALTWQNDGGGGGASTFLGLTDTPAAYTANYLTRVNAAGDALEFVDGDGIYHKQGGNSYGATSVLGTNDDYNLAFETDGVTRAFFDSTTGHFTPSSNNTYDLGTTTSRWRNIYLGPSGGGGGGGGGGGFSIHMGENSSDEAVIEYSSVNHKLTFQNTVDSRIAFQVLDIDGGSPVFNVDTINERIGIGTNSPSVKLDVRGGGIFTGEVTVGNYTFPTNDGVNGQLLKTDGNGMLAWENDIGGGGGVTTFLGLTDTPASYTAGSLLFTSDAVVTEDNANLFWDDMNDRLGVGTVTPMNTLQVNGDFNVTGAFRDHLQNEGTPGQILSSDGSFPVWIDPTAAEDGDWEIDGSDLEISVTGSALLNSNRPVTRPALTFKGHTTAGINYDDSDAEYMSLITNGIDRIKVTSWGTVGIGLAGGVFPTARLEVDGDGKFTDALTIGAYTLPNTDGTNGQVLKTDGSGTLTWQNSSGGADADWIINGNDLEIGVSGQARFNINQGEANPAISFENYTDAGINYQDLEGASMDFITNGEIRMMIADNGSIGIGLLGVQPSAQFHTAGSVRFENFGAGTMQTDADGNVSVSSDERLKNIQGIFNRGLEELLNINPIEYKWKDETGYDTKNSYYGFSAQNVKLSIPEAVGEDSRGYLTLSDRPILATAINAIKELNQKQGTQDISIIANTLKTDTNIQTLTDLQASVDENLTIINQTLLSINNQQETIDNKISVNTENLTTLSDNINSLTELTTGLVDTVNNHEERIAQLEEILTSNPELLNNNQLSVHGLENSNPQVSNLTSLTESLNTFSDNLTVIQEEDTDEDGNIVPKQIFSLSGDLIIERLKAKKIVAEEIEVAGVKAAAIVGESIFNEGKEEVFVETTAVKDNSRIFITPKGGVSTQVISLSRIESGLGFYVVVENTMQKAVPFDWFIIEDNTVGSAE